MQVITIGLDIAKNVFQVHSVDNAGNAVLRRTFGAVSLFRCFAISTRALSAWRPARRRIIRLAHRSPAMS